MTIAAINAMFDRYVPRFVAATNRGELLETLLELHGDVARHRAEDSWLRIIDAIGAGTIPLSEMRPRLEDDCVSLIHLARIIHARHGLDDAEALKQAAERIADAFFQRIDEVAAATAGRWGRA